MRTLTEILLDKIQDEEEYDTLLSWYTVIKRKGIYRTMTDSVNKIELANLIQAYEESVSILLDVSKEEAEKICREEFLNTSDRLMTDDKFIDEKLIEFGYDPEKVAQEGREFLDSLIKNNNE